MADRRDPRPRPVAVARAFAWSRDGRRLLRTALAEAVALLEADGGLVYLATEPIGELAHLLSAGIHDRRQLRLIRARRMRHGQGLFGRAVAERTITRTGDYLVDTSFPHAAGPDAFIRSLRIRSMVVAPLIAGGDVFGAIGVHSGAPDAFDDDQEALVRALADHAASAIRQGELLDALGDSRRELARRIEVERTLRTIATQLTRSRDPNEVLQVTVDAASELLGADGARIDLFQQASDGVRWSDDVATRNHPAIPDEPPGGRYGGEGISGRAVAAGRPFWTGAYLEDDRFTHLPATDAWVRENGVRSAICAVIGASGEHLGVLTAFSGRPDAFSATEGEIIASLADQAAIALTDARLIEALRDSRQALAEQAAVERALREINAEISAVGDPQQILHRIAAEGQILLRSGSVFINVLNDPTGRSGWTWYSPDEMGIDPWTPEEGIGLGEGICGKAIVDRCTIVTGDYLHDERFIHKPGPDQYTAALDLPSAIAVPIYDGDVPLGALMAESAEPDAFGPVDAERLEVLASQAGIALSNAHLLERLRQSETQLRESEARFRYLVTASPDVMWEVDIDGRFTFVSDMVHRLTGYRPEEVLGHRLIEFATRESLRTAVDQIARVQTHPGEVSSARFDIRCRDGRRIPVENFATGMFRDGVLVGAHGAARDMSEAARLERDLARQAAELASSAERAHLARELHDSVTQALFAMTLVSRSIELLLPVDPVAAMARFAELRELQREALAEMRSLIFELRPGSVERDGLAVALRQHAISVEGRVGLPIVLEMELPGRLPLEVEETLYRIAQEALHNIVRHASARQARIRLSRDERTVRMAVEDDGRGMDPAAAIPDGHLGIHGMRDRAERLGGRLTIEPRRSGGTRVLAEIPLVAVGGAA
ncbi:MAG: GAF domain-containing protein [Chloroflexota bacterium]